MSYVFPGIAPAIPADQDFAALLAEIRDRADEVNALRHVPRDLVQKLKQAGIYRAVVARRFGGDERSPGEFCRLIEAIAAADGSTAWVASFGVSATYLASLPLETLEKLYADGPDVVMAGAMFPLQPVRKTDTGVEITGRWPFGSGCMGADVIGVGIAIDGDSTGGLPRVAIMPAAQVHIDQVWNTIGLRGTGSHDVVVENVAVAEEWTMVRGAPASVPDAIYQYPKMAFAAQVLAVVGLGVARGALDEVAAAASGRTSITGAPKAAERPYVQAGIARAEALLRGARAFFYEATEQVWDVVLNGEAAAPHEVALLRLAASNAAKVGAEVARIAFELTGTAEIHAGSRIARALADATVVAQHAFLNEGTVYSAGRALLGLTTPPGFP